MCVKCPAVMNGYLNNPSATALVLDSDGWFHTGDIATVRDDKIYIVDRKKDLIKVRGWQVSPAELESVLLKHEAIKDAAVVGVLEDTATGSEVPEAHVVLKQDVALTEKAVRDFLLQRLARYKVGDCKIQFRSEIPRNPSGKILRRLLSTQGPPSNSPALGLFASLKRSLLTFTLCIVSLAKRVWKKLRSRGRIKSM